MDYHRAKTVEAVVNAVKPLLAGYEPEIQSAVLADLLATWLACFQGPVKDQAREDFLAGHIDLVRELVPINEKALKDAGRIPD